MTHACDQPDGSAPQDAAVPLSGAAGGILDRLEPTPGEATQRELLDRIAVLHRRMTTMPEIEQAKGALMVVYGITAEAAFALLRWYSQHRNVKLRAIAAALTQATPRVAMGAGATKR